MVLRYARVRSKTISKVQKIKKCLGQKWNLKNALSLKWNCKRYFGSKARLRKKSALGLK